MGLSFTSNGNLSGNINNHMDGYSYDAAGNVLNDTFHNYQYDAENRMISVDSGTTATYTYDANGRRVAKVSGGSTTDYLYDLGGHAITLLNGGGGWMYGEVYAGGMHLATYSGATTNFIHSDWLGTKRILTGVSGTVSETCTSLPFGDGQSCTGTNWGFNFFTDDMHDPESNLEHTDFRQLSASEGRWLSPDPYDGSMNIGNPQSFNRYAYVGNNPVNAIDPLGLDCIYAKEDGTAEVVRGDCFSSTDNGYFVDGTIRDGSLTFNNQTGDLGFSLTNGTEGVVGGVDFNTPVNTNLVSDMLSAFTALQNGLRQNAINQANQPITSQDYINAIGSSFEKFPSVCSATGRLTVGAGKASFGAQYNTNNGFSFAGTARLLQVPYGGISPVSVSMTTRGNGGVPTLSARVGVPQLGLTLGTQGAGVSSVGVSGRFGLLNYAVNGQIGSLAQCHP